MNVILGQFYPTNSVVEKIDARIKIISTIIYIIAVFLCDKFLSYGLCTAFFLGTVYVSGLPFKILIKAMKSMLIILIFTIVVNILFTNEGNVVFSLGFINITDISVLKTVKLCLRLMLLIMFSSILTLTTKPIQLTVAIESLMKPFGKVGIPYHEMAMMMSIALRFVPTLFDELDKIKKAQQARGANLGEGNIYNRIKSLIPIIIPLFVSSFRRADELAMAMEARCYRGGVERTRLNDPVLCKKDIVVVVFMIIFTAAIAVVEYLL